MREILFRGKRIDNGEFVEGFYFFSHWYLPPSMKLVDTHYYLLPIGGGDAFQVDPETVGQFTGLTDKNGTKVFEGDIIRVNTDGQNILGWVSFERSGFHFRFGKHGTALLTEWAKPLKVIGNVHDTPERLKEE